MYLDFGKAFERSLPCPGRSCDLESSRADRRFLQWPRTLTIGGTRRKSLLLALQGNKTLSCPNSLTKDWVKPGLDHLASLGRVIIHDAQDSHGKGTEDSQVALVVWVLGAVQTWLHIRNTWTVLKNTDSQALSQAYLTQISRGKVLAFVFNYPGDLQTID